MSNITVAGAGAFGTALAISLAREGNSVTLLARNSAAASAMQSARRNVKYLNETTFPNTLTATADPEALGDSGTILLVVPTQNLREFLVSHKDRLNSKTCVLCCKGIEKDTGLLASQIVDEVVQNTKTAVLTGPGFAHEIAMGLPTALTLATTDCDDLQSRLSTQTLRLYLSADPVGAQLGGALKNVIAIACGIAMGAGLGESARAALMTRGYAEMVRLAVGLGGQPATLSGLSGLGDLALTCTSMQSRNFSLGFTLGQGGAMKTGTTFEGVATARATLTLAARCGIDMPLSRIVTAVLEHKQTIPEAVDALLSRPLKSE